MRAVLDVNVIISGLVSPGGAPARALTEWLEGGYDLVVSPALLEELEPGTGVGDALLGDEAAVRRSVRGCGL